MAVQSVKVGDFILPGMFTVGGQPIPGGSPTPPSYAFGHTFPVQIQVTKIKDCRLYWLERTNLPIIDEQSPDYFVDMFTLRPTANTFRPWVVAQQESGPGPVTVTVKDIPALVITPQNAGEEIYRWLEIIALVQSVPENQSRFVFFRQDLLYNSSLNEIQARGRMAELGVSNLDNFLFSDGRAYSFHVAADNLPLGISRELLGMILALTGAPPNSFTFGA
ncbi:hypothetical protein [Oleisolibacter albus]|uniref:hypothetical protein n=1 Tax=Oleisolibacter albus TaxID=2171757 RepID=UPI000DF1C2E9|nr:hypothetical protein [Oleisolibacter albus]